MPLLDLVDRVPLSASLRLADRRRRACPRFALLLRRSVPRCFATLAPVFVLRAPDFALRARFAILASVFGLLLAAHPARAQWSTDPEANNAIADRAAGQVVPKIAVTSAGDTYIAWFDPAAGSYDVYLQLLTPAGVEVFPHNGILVSDHPQLSSLVDWDLIADSQGNAVVTFTDVRDGGDLDAFAYRIAPDQTFLWGADGIQLSIESDYTPSPVVTEASDGDFVFVWARLPDEGDGSLRMQRLSPDGTTRFAAGGIDIVTAPNESPGFAQVIPSDDGSVIVAYVRDIDTFTAPRHLRAIRVASDGTIVWGPVTVYDTVSLPIAHQPRMKPDGEGGAMLCWHRFQGGLYNSLVQHLHADGTEAWPHQGVAVAAAGTLYHINPSFGFAPESGSTFVFWNEEPTNQSQFGIFGQRIAADGSLAWGASGIAFVPMSTTFRSPPRVVAFADGAMVFFADQPTAQFGQERVLGYRVDEDGQVLWGPVEVSSHLSSKSRLPVTIDASGVSRMVWEDDRSGDADVYGQAITSDGVLGASTTSVGEVAQMASAVCWSPNPFSTHARSLSSHTTLTLRPLGELPVGEAPLGEGPVGGSILVRILDVNGRQVRALSSSAGETIVRWDGRDESGHALPSGVYFSRWSLTPSGNHAGADGALKGSIAPLVLTR